MKEFADKNLGWLKDKDQTWNGFFIEILFLIGMVLFIRFYVFQFFRVSGPSMCPTLNQFDTKCEYGKGEFIFVNEFVYRFLEDPNPGEIVVFNPPFEEEKKYIKRVIGVPGDKIIIENGIVYKDIDGERLKLEEPYLSEKNSGNTSTDKNEFIVPEDHYLLFGDNRTQSLDSRRCFSNKGCRGRYTPFVHKNEIIGRAESVVFPFNRFRKMDHTLK